MRTIKPWILISIFVLLLMAMITNAFIEYSSNQQDLQRIMEEHARLLTGQVLTTSQLALNADRSMTNHIKDHLLKIRSEYLASNSKFKPVSADTLFRVKMPDSLSEGEIFSQRLSKDSLTNQSWFYMSWYDKNGMGTTAGMRADYLMKFREENGIGIFLNELTKHEEVLYAMVQDSSTILISARRYINQLLSEKEIENVLQHPDSLFVIPIGERKIEVRKAFIIDETPIGVFRIGISVAIWDTFSSRLNRRLSIAVLLLTGLSMAFITIFSLLKKRADLARKLEQNQLLEEKAKAQAELAAGVAHELRNPLNSIATLVQQVDKDFISVENNEELHQLLQIVRKEILRINGKITDFLRLSRPALPEKKELLISEWMADFKTEIQAIGSDKKVEIKVSYPNHVTFFADTNQLGEIIRNLVRNAVDSVNENGHVNLKITVKENDCIISVEDDGAGIPAENKSRIFDLYFTTKPDGTGIGLAMVRQMTAALGGTIEVRDRKPNGTFFILKFPLKD